MKEGMIHRTVRLYGSNTIGNNCIILENVIIGYPDVSILKELIEQGIQLEDYQFEGAVIGENALLRTGSVLYCRVRIGDNFQTGHNVLIREDTTIGKDVRIGTNTVIEGKVVIGNNVNIQSNAFIPINTEIGDFVFIGPNAVLTNDKYPPSRRGTQLKGPIIKKGVSVGANAIILSGISIGEGSLVAAGAVVTRDVAAWQLAIGSPARMSDLPENLHILNKP